MKLVRTKLPSGAFKIVDEDSKRIYALSISADKVEAFIAKIKASRPQKEKDAEFAVLLARTKKANAGLLRKK